MKVAEIMVEVLANAGVQRCYGIVGDTLNHFTDAIYHSKKIQWIHMRHEEAGGFAAGADALITKKPTACAGSCGPGSLHFINSLMDAGRNRAPVILIASQLDVQNLGTHFPQEVDFKKIYESFAVYCEQINTPEEAQYIMTMAVQNAINKRGVAVVIMPVNISVQSAQYDPNMKIHLPNPVFCPNEDEIKEIVSLISKGKKVGIYAGAGVEGAHDELVKFAEKIKAPIAHSARSKDFVEYDNPYNMGMTGLVGVKSGFDMMNECDVLLVLGSDLAWRQFYPQKAVIIQVDNDCSHLGRRCNPKIAVLGDVKHTLKKLIEAVSEKTDRSFLDHCLKIKEETDKKLLKDTQAPSGDIIHPQFLTGLIDKYAPKDALFAADGGSPMVWALRYLTGTRERRIFTSLLHGTMANAMPMCLGLKKAFPNKEVISFSGDGGLAMLLGDLLSAIQENIPIKVVVFNNSSLNFVELEQKVEGLLDNYTDLKNPSFADLSRVIGFDSWRVEKSSDLEENVKNFFNTKKPALLDVVVNPKELVMPPKVELSEVAHFALYSAKALIAGRANDVEELIKTNINKLI
ncbi:thiamine pyrophosphate-dependent enzyme [Helicobacter cappadocius]|uniref:Thiamine pyrophosphate-binding protein n=1 Tax=Helicobacter cappadocius TaxID=3063998 RepID=A0AA90TFB6_9HELI|nr:MULTISPECIES: thiamine pyrophosphate-dependent enzyme [unclassified Helicobacter]MDO7253538.1 thiamine pyrophosphate-binding protein [Helicobacter sp. faydin-H75]MDP2539465.1 thiamine pyrophosphate-binding protein [Helicobacter sp. faydin-H76]